MAGVTHQCQEHTELLVHELKLGLLWDGWGIVGDVVVGVFSCPNCYLLPCLSSQIILTAWYIFAQHTVSL